MKKGRYASSRKSSVNGILAISVVILSAALVFALGLLIGQNRQNQPQIPEEATMPLDIPEGNIAIPGFEYIDLTAGTTRQDKVLVNPSVNECLFLLTLKLEDGTVLWVSDHIRPGKASDPITLTQTLAAGEYPATLIYECFALDRAMSPLNGAEIDLILRVK